MTILRFELRKLRASLIIWAASLSAAIFLMLPVYIDMLTAADSSVLDTAGGNAFFKSIGTSIEILSTPMGTYSFLTFFVLFAVAINGMNTGLNLITKEYRHKSVDFLLTKPFSRSQIFISKLLAAAGASFMIGIGYFFSSWAAMVMAAGGDFRFTHLALIAASVFLMQLIYIALGMLAGILAPRIKATVSISAGTAFVTYAIGSMSRTVGSKIIGFLSPYRYFDGAHIISEGVYEPVFMTIYALFMLAFIILGHHLFCKKDLVTVS